jgi:hypothetical protein
MKQNVRIVFATARLAQTDKLRRLGRCVRRPTVAETRLMSTVMMTAADRTIRIED